MKQYERYKDSGLEWLGKIPDYWEIKRFKDTGRIVLGKMLNNTNLPNYYLKYYLKSKNIGWFKLNLDSVEEMYFSKAELKTHRVKKNDLLLSEGGEVGKTAIWNEELDECYIQNSVHKVTLNRNQCPRYFLYLSFAIGQSKYYDSIVNQVSIKHLTYEKLTRVSVCIPPYDEQLRIADYLDSKIQYIDKKIELLYKKIDIYKELRKALINKVVCRGLDDNVPLKDSGVEWIGKIPAHWEIVRLMSLGNIETSSIDKKIKDGEQLVKLVNYTDVYNNRKKEIRNHDKYMIVSANKKQIQSKFLKKGDVLFTPSSETIEDIGVSATIIENMDNTLYSYHLLRFRFNKRKDIFLDYKKYLLNNDLVQYYFSNKSIGTTRKILGLNTFNNLLLIMPPYHEQRSITEFLNDKIQKIDSILENIHQQIEKLQELRKTLINNVVTGKIKITE